MVTIKGYANKATQYLEDLFDHGFHPLGYQGREVDAIKELLDDGADINCEGRVDLLEQYLRYGGNDLNIIKFLIDNGLIPINIADISEYLMVISPSYYAHFSDTEIEKEYFLKKSKLKSDIAKYLVDRGIKLVTSHELCIEIDKRSNKNVDEIDDYIVRAR